MPTALVGVTTMALAAMALTATAAPAPGVVPEVSLDLERCSLLPRAEIIRLVGLELDARVLPPNNASPHATRGTVACGGSGVRLEVADPLTGKFLSRTIAPVGREGDAAARIVALAFAELVFTSWMELVQPRGQPVTSDAPPLELRRAAMERAQRHAVVPSAAPTPAPSSPAPVAAAPAPAPPAPERAVTPDLVPPPRAEAPPSTAASTTAVVTASEIAQTGPDSAYVLAVGEATGPFAGVGMGWGAGARIGWTSGSTLFTLASSAARLGGDLDLTATRADVASTLGSIRVSTWSAAPRASLKLYLDGERGAWVDVGAGARLGVARLVGSPADSGTTRGGSLAGTWGGVAVYTGIGVSLGPVVVAAGIEGGQVLRTVAGLVDGDGTGAISVAGRWLSGSLALGWGR